MYRWIDHTAEVELELEAASEADVLADALRALAELLGEEATPAGRKLERRSLLVSAPDRPALLAAWLEELVFLAESEGFVAEQAERIELTEDAVRAELEGHLGDPPPLVKAVTYHRLEFEPSDHGYRGRVVLDV